MSAEAISTENNNKTKKARNSFGFVMFTFEKDLGKVAKGKKKKMHRSTAAALAAHKIGSISEIPKKEN
jgi:hypothetical protein